MQQRKRKAQQKQSVYMQHKLQIQRLQALVLVLLHANKTQQIKQTQRKLRKKAA